MMIENHSVKIPKDYQKLFQQSLCEKYWYKGQNVKNDEMFQTFLALNFKDKGQFVIIELKHNYLNCR